MKNLINNIYIVIVLLIISQFECFSQCNTTLAHWDFNDCTKGNMIRDGLPPIITPAGCPNVTTRISRVELKNSCAERSASNDANCLGGNDLLAWQDGADDAVVITVSFPTGSTGRLGGLSFIQGLHDIAEFNGDPNNPPTRWGIRVVKNGTEIFQEIDKTFVLNAWTLRTFDWSSNPAFTVSGATTFQIEILGYLPSTTINPTADHTIWELDDVMVTGGCCTVPASCNLANGNLTSVVCKNNGTTSVTTDDYIEFRLNPTGTGLGTQYTVSVNSGTVTPTTANYGTTTIFRLQNGSAGGGNKTITIRDKASPTCSRTVTVNDPGTCSSTPLCSISGTVSNITCNNNSTTSNSTDDRIVFQLRVTGTGNASTYNVSVQGGGTISPTSASYGSTVTFTMAAGTAGGGNKTIIITDAISNTCTISKTVTDPGTCSAGCSFSAIVSNIACNNNGTSTVSGDDRITFTLNASGNGTASTYNVSVQGGGTISPTSGSYGSNVNFTLAAGTAGGGNKTIILTDASTGTCTRSVVVTDPGSCSVDCPTTTYHICNSESYTLSAPTGMTNYQWMVNTGSGYTNVSGGNTRTIVVSSAGTYKFTATDGSGCLAELCCPYEITKTTLTGTGFGSSVMCDDNGTETDPLDDKITFTLNPTGTGLSGSYNVSVQGGGSITPSSASYGVTTIFTLAEGSAGGGNKVIIIADSDHPTCTINANITDPDPCSCTLSVSNLTNVSCNNNGTAGTTSDDRIKFNLNPNGIVGNSYTVSVNSGTIFPTTGIYGSVTIFTLNAGSAGGGNKIVTITDDDDPNCTVSVTIIDPGPCSSCQYNDPLITYAVCDTKGTATTSDDDFILYTNPGGLGLGAFYNVSVTCSGTSCTCSRNNVPYGTPQEICRLPVGFGVATVTVTDASGLICQLVGTTSEGQCGTSCNINSSGLDIVCNGTSTYNIVLNPTGTGLGSRYHVTGDYNFAFVPYGAPFDIVVNIPVNSGVKNIVITDANSATCTFPISIPNQTCSPCVTPTATAAATNPTCVGGTAQSNGTITISGFTTERYQYTSGATFSGAATPASITAIPVGGVIVNNLANTTQQYTVRIYDATDDNCFVDRTVSITALAPPMVSCTPTANTNCINPNGMITTNATGVTYLWNTMATTSSIAGLSATIYTVTVTSTTTGCTATCTAEIVNNTVNPTCNITVNSQPNCANLTGGDITVVASPVGTYTYNWSDIGTGTANRTGLVGGTYFVTVTNTTTGCTGVCSVMLTIPTNCCNIAAIVPQNIVCIDNGTPAIITDNRIRFSATLTNADVLLTGYNVTINGGTTITPTSGTYGVSTQFTLGPGTAGGGATFTVTVTDSATAGCTQTFQVIDPGGCNNTTPCPTPKCGTATIQVNGN